MPPKKKDAPVPKGAAGAKGAKGAPVPKDAPAKGAKATAAPKGVKATAATAVPAAPKGVVKALDKAAPLAPLDNFQEKFFEILNIKYKDELYEGILTRITNLLTNLLKENDENKDKLNFFDNIIVKDKLKFFDNIIVKARAIKNKDNRRKTFLFYLINNIIYAITLSKIIDNKDATNDEYCSQVVELFKFRFMKLQDNDDAIRRQIVNKHKFININLQVDINRYFEKLTDENNDIYIKLNEGIHLLEYDVLNHLQVLGFAVKDKIDDKQVDIDDKQVDIDDKQDDIVDKQDGIIDKQDGIIDKYKEAIKAFNTTREILGSTGSIEKQKGETYKIYYQLYYCLGIFLENCLEKQIVAATEGAAANAEIETQITETLKLYKAKDDADVKDDADEKDDADVKDDADEKDDTEANSNSNYYTEIKTLETTAKNDYINYVNKAIENFKKTVVGDKTFYEALTILYNIAISSNSKDKNLSSSFEDNIITLLEKYKIGLKFGEFKSSDELSKKIFDLLLEDKDDENMDGEEPEWLDNDVGWIKSIFKNQTYYKYELYRSKKIYKEAILEIRELITSNIASIETANAATASYNLQGFLTAIQGIIRIATIANYRASLSNSTDALNDILKTQQEYIKECEERITEAKDLIKRLDEIKGLDEIKFKDEIEAVKDAVNEAKKKITEVETYKTKTENFIKENGGKINKLLKDIKEAYNNSAVNINTDDDKLTEISRREDEAEAEAQEQKKYPESLTNLIRAIVVMENKTPEKLIKARREASIKEREQAENEAAEKKEKEEEERKRQAIEREKERKRKDEEPAVAPQVAQEEEPAVAPQVAVEQEVAEQPVVEAVAQEVAEQPVVEAVAQEEAETQVAKEQVEVAKPVAEEQVEVAQEAVAEEQVEVAQEAVAEEQVEVAQEAVAEEQVEAAEQPVVEEEVIAKRNDDNVNVSQSQQTIEAPAAQQEKEDEIEEEEAAQQINDGDEDYEGLKNRSERLTTDPQAADIEGEKNENDEDYTEEAFDDEDDSALASISENGSTLDSLSSNNSTLASISSDSSKDSSKDSINEVPILYDNTGVGQNSPLTITSSLFNRGLSSVASTAKASVASASSVAKKALARTASAARDAVSAARDISIDAASAAASSTKEAVSTAREKTATALRGVAAAAEAATATASSTIVARPIVEPSTEQVIDAPLETEERRIEASLETEEIRRGAPLETEEIRRGAPLETYDDRYKAVRLNEGLLYPPPPEDVDFRRLKSSLDTIPEITTPLTVSPASSPEASPRLTPEASQDTTPEASPRLTPDTSPETTPRPTMIPTLPVALAAPIAYEPIDEETLKGRYLYTHKYNDVKDDDLRNIRVFYNKPRRPDIDDKIGLMSADIDIYNNGDDGGDGGATAYSFEDIKSKLNRFENDPNNPIEAFEIRFEDRLVFIITTFFIRYAAISIIQRGIDINLVKSFYEGFIYYGAIYIIFFWFIVLFINIDNNYTVGYLDLNGLINYIRSLFYYFFMGTNGISRLLIHSLLILVIIIIPIILNIKYEKTKDPLNVDADADTDAIERIKPLTLEERTKLSKAISLFTLLIWILTSIIATKF
jgi:hypothetical protein